MKQLTSNVLAVLAGGVVVGSVRGSLHPLNVSDCPGYIVRGRQNTDAGFRAELALTGPPCNAFGSDIANLTLEVSYESQSRLHVHIFDTKNQQFQVPESVFTRPTSSSLNVDESDLEFHYNSSPFEFWITRKEEGKVGAPLFDTRRASLPATPIPPLNASDSRTALDGFALVFEDQYLQVTSALPIDTNIYGLGEVIASSGFRRDIEGGKGAKGGVGTVQAMWARGAPDPVDENLYGSHAVYMEHRFDESSGKSRSHGVFLLNSAGGDALLLTPPKSRSSLVQYRYVGGTLDFYFLSGPTPQKVVEQYAEVVGLPTWQPYWAFGFHLCRWGYANISVMREHVQQMRKANIPLEVMWSDIDLYHSFRGFTTDPVSFPGEEMRKFIRELASNNQRFIPIVDAAIPITVNRTDIYNPYTSGVAQNVFITNPDGSEYIGQVRGFTAFPDWFSNHTQTWWTQALRNWSTTGGVEFSGIWLDKNEPASTCEGSCGSNRSMRYHPDPVPLPGEPEDEIFFLKNLQNKIVMDQYGSTYKRCTNKAEDGFEKRGLGAGGQGNMNLNNPPYAIHNGDGRLSIKTVATNASSAAGYAQLDIHNLFGLMEEKGTHLAVRDVIPGKRPFLISRSTFPSSGKWTGHWLGDNLSKWEDMHFSIQGILQFQLFQIPMVGADACGFNGDTSEELCSRWMQLAAFSPFYRNHNVKEALPQEPYRWESVANASRTAMTVRYSLLPLWYTLFANASMRGTPPVRALFWEFPDEPELFAVDRQFMIGRDILITPVLQPNVSTVDGIFPGRGSVIWRDWYTHEKVNAVVRGYTTLLAPAGHINVHVRDGAILLLHAQPAYTTTETRAGPYALLVTLSSSLDASAFGTAYIDDGVTSPPCPNTTLIFRARAGRLRSKPAVGSSFNIALNLTKVTILGVLRRPSDVVLQGRSLGSGNWAFNDAKGELLVTGVGVQINLNEDMTLEWI